MRIQNQAVIADHWQVERPLTTTGQHYLLRTKGQVESPELGVLSLLPTEFDAETAARWCRALSETPHPGIMLPQSALMVQGQAAVLTASVQGRPLDEVRIDSLPDLLRLMARTAELLHALHSQGRYHGTLEAGLIWLRNTTTPRLCGLLPTADATCPVDDSAIQTDLQALAAITLEQLIDPTAALSERCRQSYRDYPEAIALCKLHGAPRGQMAAPESLARLLHRILDADADADDTSTPAIGMIEWRDQLDDLALAMTRSAPRSSPDWSIAAVAASTPAPSSISPAHLSDPSPEPASRRWIGQTLAASLAVSALLLGSWWWFGSYRNAPAPAVTEVEVAAEPAEPLALEPELPEVPDEAALQALFEAREAAQKVLDALIADRQILDERAVTEWAAEPFEHLLSLKSAGDQAYVQQDFVNAGEQYSAALAISQTLVERWEQERDAANQRGMTALAEGDSATALASFTLAAAIDAEHPVATRGLARAAVLDQVLLLSRQARQALRDEDPVAARALYLEVQELDADTPEIAQHISSIDAQLTDQAYREAVSQGLSALEQGRLEVARTRFDEANRIRPGTSVVRDGLQDIQRRLRDQRVVDHRQRAEQLIDQELWQDAVRHFDEILKRDPDAAFAQRGREQASRRLTLDKSLTEMLGNPSRWWSPRGRELMQARLDEAVAIAQPGPRLNDQISRLQVELSRSNQPIEVALMSDNQCQVDVYRVSRLGQFAQTSLKLKPGSYTVVGTRPGYRDVRKVVHVQAGQSPDPVQVVCDEEV